MLSRTAFEDPCNMFCSVFAIPLVLYSARPVQSVFYVTTEYCINEVSLTRADDKGVTFHQSKVSVLLGNIHFTSLSGLTNINLLKMTDMVWCRVNIYLYHSIKIFYGWNNRVKYNGYTLHSELHRWLLLYFYKHTRNHARTKHAHIHTCIHSYTHFHSCTLAKHARTHARSHARSHARTVWVWVKY